MDLGDVLRSLERAGTAQNRKIYARHGAAEPMFGVSYAELGKIRRRVGIDHSLAQELWDSANHDARVLALQIADPDRLTKSLANRWLRAADNYILVEGIGGLVARSPMARRTSDDWRGRRREWSAAAGWFTVACTADDSAVWSTADLGKLVAEIEATIHGRPNRVRHEMVLVLIAIGLRNGRLRRTATAAARRIGPVDVDHGETGCKTPDAVDYIERTLAHRAAKANT